MTERTPYSRSHASILREKAMRYALAPLILRNIGTISLNTIIGKMQLVTVQPESGQKLVVWVKCAWKPGKSGTCAVQMAFPSKENKAHNAEEVISMVVEKRKRAMGRGATHILFLAADDEGYSPLAAYLLPIKQIDNLIKRAIKADEFLTRNGSSPSIYITTEKQREAALVEIVKKLSLDLLKSPQQQLPLTDDAIEDLDMIPTGVISPFKTSRTSETYSRDQKIRSFVLSRSKGHCEYCGEKGFLMSDGKSHYLETHHIIALAAEGQDTIKNVIALCPRHHREAHFGVNRDLLETEMTKLLKKAK